MQKIAVVLFNLGGPDGPDAVRPFLFNLFNDPAIIAAPGPLRWLLAQLVSWHRAPRAREIYGHLGGGSPLLANTAAQAEALEAVLRDRWSAAGRDVRVFVAMRYWHPRSREIADSVKAYGPDGVIALPLYPQFSTTTSGSSLDDWARAAAAVSLGVPTKAVCCYPEAPGFIGQAAANLRAALDAAAAGGRPRVLFSAHGLPKKTVAAGDPYQWQVERTAAAIVEALGGARAGDLDWLVCYQSRVGPLEWLGPYTDAEIEHAGREGVPLVVAPIAFVSEHSETLVELDIEYRRLAEQAGVPLYVRVPTVGTGQLFIEGLADLVEHARSYSGPICSAVGGRICPPGARRCGQETG